MKIFMIIVLLSCVVWVTSYELYLNREVEINSVYTMVDSTNPFRLKTDTIKIIEIKKNWVRVVNNDNDTNEISIRYINLKYKQIR